MKIKILEKEIISSEKIIKVEKTLIKLFPESTMIWIILLAIMQQPMQCLFLIAINTFFTLLEKSEESNK